MNADAGLFVYIWTSESYANKENMVVPLAQWNHPIIPGLGDTITIDGVPKIISRIYRVFEPIGEDLVVNVVVDWR